MLTFQLYTGASRISSNNGLIRAVVDNGVFAYNAFKDPVNAVPTVLAGALSKKIAQVVSRKFF